MAKLTAEQVTALFPFDEIIGKRVTCPATGQVMEITEMDKIHWRIVIDQIMPIPQLERECESCGGTIRIISEDSEVMHLSKPLAITYRFDKTLKFEEHNPPPPDRQATTG